MRKVLAHIPRLALRNTPEMALAEGRLRVVPLAEWRQLDDAFPNRDPAYQQIAPVFYEYATSEFTESAGDAQFLAQFDAALRPTVRAHQALLLSTGVPVEDPRVSMTYVVTPNRDDAPGGALRFVGLAERELILFDMSGERLAVTGELANDINAAITLLHGELPLEFMHLVEDLQRATFPGMSGDLISLRLATALETLLAGDVRTGEIGQMFARRLAVLLADAEESPERLLPFGQAMYKHRSDLIHARGVEPEAGGVDAWLIQNAFPFAAYLTRRLLYLVSATPQLASLRAKIDASWNSPEARARLLEG